MFLSENREADLEAASSDCPPSSSAASEDVIDITESEIALSRVQSSVRSLLQGIGEDTNREGLRDTPKRVAKAWIDATEGYRQSVRSVLGGAIFHEAVGSRREHSVVLVKDVEFASTSEHNLLPFFGHCHIAYVPRNGVVLGLSKVARLAKMFSRRLQNQQRLTDQLLEAFNAEVQPLGCAAVIEACQTGAGTKEIQTTSSTLGCFYEQPEVFLQEFAMLLGKPDLTSLTKHCRPVEQTPLIHPLTSLKSTQSPALPQGNGARALKQIDSMVAAVEAILREIGEDLNRQGLQGSPERYVNHLIASTAGIGADLPGLSCSLLSEGPDTWQTSTADVFCMAFTSQCEHHLLPFQGTVQVVCLAGPSRAHLSKSQLEGLVQAFSSRLQIQERLTHQLAEAIHTALGSAGTLVLCQAVHMCMVARGVEKRSSTTITMEACGVFKTSQVLRSHALQRLHFKQVMS